MIITTCPCVTDNKNNCQSKGKLSVFNFPSISSVTANISQNWSIDSKKMSKINVNYSKIDVFFTTDNDALICANKISLVQKKDIKRISCLLIG